MKIMETGTDIKIKAYEIDAMGIVSNIHYVKWFEDLRHIFLDKYYPYDEMMEVGISPVLLKTEINYKKSLTIHDHPRGISWVTKMDKMRWEMQYEIWAGETLCCSGTQQGCFFDVNKQKPVRVPEKLSEAYKQTEK